MPKVTRRSFVTTIGAALPNTEVRITEDGELCTRGYLVMKGYDAEEEATRLMVDYGGEPEVTDDGVVVYAFKALRRTAGGAAGSAGSVAPAWAPERLEPTPPLTGNEAGTNALVGIFNGFNLLAPFWIVPAFEARTHISLASWQFLTVTFPIAFSSRK
jgi:hypothetical protein